VLRVLHVLAGLAVALSLSLAACGGDGDDGGASGGGEAPGGGERAAVEKAARDYIVEQQSDDDDTENPGAIRFDTVDVSGEQAEVKGRSSLTGNRYEVTLSKQGRSWRGLSLLTDRPSEPTGGGGDPSAGGGKEVPSTEVEQQIETRLLGPLGIDGDAECPSTIRLRRGNNFECKVTGERKATVQVTQKNDRGSLNYKIKLGKR
jgi:Domain of unknown function (DUF4333)